MPFPQDIKLYEAMRSQADVISSAIDSLNVQVRWGGLHLTGVSDAEAERLDPLFLALRQYEGIEGALATFTEETFVHGNVAIFVAADVTKMWRPNWRDDPALQGFIAQGKGRVIEARRPPVNAGYGTPCIEAGAAAFARYWNNQGARIGELERFVSNPASPMPRSRVGQDRRLLNDVLNAIGFDPWDEDDLPTFRHSAQLRAETKELFEAQVLRPYAAHIGLQCVPSLAP